MPADEQPLPNQNLTLIIGIILLAIVPLVVGLIIWNSRKVAKKNS